jgi:CHAD domain-containing protein
VSEWLESDEGRLIVRVVVRGLVHVARNEITEAESSVRRARLEGDPDDPVSIRLLRLAIRRVEYQLTTMSALDSSLEVADLVDGLHEIGKPFGELRDAEILSARVAKALGERITLPEGNRLMEIVGEERYLAQRESDASLDSKEFHAALAALNDFRASLPADAVTAAMARPVAQLAIRVTWRAVKAAVRAAEHDSSDELLHALRRAVKHTAYMTKSLSYVLGPSSKEFTARLINLQKLLGRQHDHVIVAKWLRDVGDNHASLLPLAHEVSDEERRRADKDAGEWRREWRSIRDLRPKKTVMTSYSFFD